jgi:hypothetical protein
MGIVQVATNVSECSLGASARGERHTGKAMHTGASDSTHDVDMQHSFIDPVKQQHIAPNRAHRKEHSILIHNTLERQRKVVRACVSVGRYALSP